MKILVLSDSHGSLTNAIEVINDIKGSVDVIIHLGDYTDDAKYLKQRFTDMEFIGVSGNCDFDIGGSEKLIKLCDKKIFITHGHRYDVKYNCVKLSYRADEKNADICLFGHTHRPLIIERENMIIMNPGSISQPRGIDICSYGIIDINADGKVTPSIIGIYGNRYKKIEKFM